MGLYAQFRALKTIMIGLGWLKGDWEKEHHFNRQKIYIIEPIMESLLQVKLVVNPVFSTMFNMHVNFKRHSMS